MSLVASSSRRTKLVIRATHPLPGTVSKTSKIPRVAKMLLESIVSKYKIRFSIQQTVANGLEVESKDTSLGGVWLLAAQLITRKAWHRINSNNRTISWIPWYRPCTPSSKTYFNKTTVTHLWTEITGNQLKPRLQADRVPCCFREKISPTRDTARKKL